jgi:hypothetical protein
MALRLPCCCPRYRKLQAEELIREAEVPIREAEEPRNEASS